MKSRKPRLGSEELRIEIKALTEKTSDRFSLSQRELSDELSVSPASLSKWLNAKYPGDSRALERNIRGWLAARSLTNRDIRRLGYINSLLDNADNKQALVRALQWDEQSFTGYERPECFGTIDGPQT